MSALLPWDAGYDTGQIPELLGTYLEHRRASGAQPLDLARELLQYGPTAGTIRPVVAAALDRDDGIRADPESIVVTVGAQEAMLLVLRALFAGPRDVLAVEPMAARKMIAANGTSST